MYKIWPTWPNGLHFEFYVIFYYFFVHFQITLITTWLPTRLAIKTTVLYKVWPAWPHRLHLKYYFLKNNNLLSSFITKWCLFTFFFWPTFWFVYIFCLLQIEQSLTYGLYCEFAKSFANFFANFDKIILAPIPCASTYFRLKKLCWWHQFTSFNKTTCETKRLKSFNHLPPVPICL